MIVNLDAMDIHNSKKNKNNLKNEKKQQPAENQNNSKYQNVR